MSYIDRTLLPNEKVVYFAKPHYVLFLKIIFLVLVSALFYFYVWPVLGVLALVMCLVALIATFARYYFSEFGITNRRIIMKVGLIKSQSLEIFMERVESILVEQTIVGRVLNYGTVIVCGIGGTKDPFLMIPDPQSFRAAAEQQIAEKQSRNSKS